MMEILAFIPPILIGSAIVVMVVPQLSRKGICAVLTVCLGSGIGLGITSASIFLWLAWVGRPGAAYIVFEAGSAILLVFIAYYRVHKYRSGSPNNATLDCGTNDVPIKWLRRLFIILLIISSGSFGLKSFLEMPYGTVDVRIVWNYRARWLFKGGDQWKFAFYSPVARDVEYEDDIGHAADYPLLVTGSVYRGWEITGNDRVAVPIMIAAMFTFATYLLLYVLLALLRNRNQGYLAVLLLLVSTQFLHLGTDQYGDVPLAFFILSTVALLALKDRYPAISLQLLVLAGFTASCAAWTKNEGLMFFLLVIAVRFIGQIGKKDWYRSIKEFFYFFWGLLPVTGTLLYFKIQFAPRNDMINIPTLKKTALHLLDIDRYIVVIKAVFERIFTFNDGIVVLMAVYFLISGLDRSGDFKKHPLPHVMLLLLMMCGYIFAYVITPYELEWHIGSSLRRLFIQLWPAWIFIFFYCVRGPEQSAEEDQPRELSHQSL
jgi:hypothetical protein